MAGHGSWDERPWERGEGGRGEERWRGERREWRPGDERWRERAEEDLGARGREEWGGREGRREPERGGGRDWRAAERDERGWVPPERRWTEWEGERRGRDWPAEGGRRPEPGRPWLERPPMRGRGDTRGMVEWEDRGPLAWLGDRVREGRRRARGPKGYTRSDERIQDEVCERIARSGIGADEVEVRVSNRDVTLTGTVRSREEKWWIEDLAEDVFGVEEVHNQLRVSRASTDVRGEGPGGAMPH